MKFHALLVPFVYITLIVILFLIFAVVEIVSAGNVSFPLPILVFLSGSLGGVISNYRRLHEIPQSNNAEDNFTSLSKQQKLIAIFQIYVTPLIGGIFGVLLYAVFMTGLLQHLTFNFGLLPQMRATGNTGFINVIELFKVTGPDKNKDAFLIIIYAFMAGFSEKMIPNFLDKLAEKIKSTKTEINPD